MKFLVEFCLSSDAKNRVDETFSRWRPRSEPVVMFHGARVGKRYNVLFVMGEGDNEELIARACQSWDEHGMFRIYPLSDAG